MWYVIPLKLNRTGTTWKTFENCDVIPCQLQEYRAKNKVIAHCKQTFIVLGMEKSSTDFYCFFITLYQYVVIIIFYEGLEQKVYSYL